ncbi:Uncharacterised protein [Salmonella enterica subsp. enterica serovar Bovismorbificans]|uniref:Uncharacterized protein n=1 Tax=Salmonella enterica subsp. enterica serovar Bovismorbificans TaxID=58097 RepID=A0A655C892_SALET|nr:Uncharacterised protein [Salmonella enterica subsp. enterica serovar Bovismorbificans]CNU00895.1 Uncharacterised protein [Salmonella enterica subsp. enterica serovar Bovismorbificans]CNU67526.1 Uncharacterised protein [Salmonella enterica subsp. enterica serovar Bovismorbificans]
MGFVAHLAENTVGNIIVAPPVGSSFCVGKLVHIVTVQFMRQPLGGGINFAGALHKMTVAAVKLNLFDFTFCGTGGHDGDERQSQ